MNNRKFFLLLVLASFIAILIHITLLLKGFYSISADESGRTLDAYFWITNDPRLSDVWLPFYRVLLGYALLIYHDLFLVPRILSNLFGIGVCCIIVWFTNELFHKREITLVAAFASAVFPHRIILAVVPLTEIIFIFFTLTAFTFFIRWCSTRKFQFLFLVSIFLGVTTTVRYEGWLFSGTFVLFLIHQQLIVKQSNISLRLFLSLCAIVCAFPLYWFFDNAIREGSPLFFWMKTSANYERAHTSLLKLIWRNVAAQFFLWNTLSLNIIGVFSLFSLYRTNTTVKQLSVLIVVPLLLLSGFQFFGHTLPTHNPWRTAAIWGVLLLPFASYYLYETFKSSRSQFAGLCIVLVVLCFAQTFYLARNSYFTKEEKLAGEFLEQQIINNTHVCNVLIENPDWCYLNIVIASQHPENYLFNSGFNPYESNKTVLNPKETLTSSILQEKQIKYLALKTPSYKNYVSQYSFVQKVKDFGEWCVYKFVQGD